MRVLGRAYAVISEAGLNFDLEVNRSEYPGKAGVLAEWKQFTKWGERFVVSGAGSAEAVKESGQHNGGPDEKVAGAITGKKARRRIGVSKLIEQAQAQNRESG